jgi:2-polyprenyl-3-methyl-5-hydroxy-6-metoxy-1,4-benzoquinol methylase
MRLKNTYETLALHTDWEAVYRGNPLQDHLNSRIMARVMAAIAPAPDAIFLDAGCGVGYHSLAIARRGNRCVGIDISEEVLQTARNNLNQPSLSERVSFRCEELERLTFADATFDVVHCRGVLMHIPQWEVALGELCRVLKPGGRIVVMEANRRSIEACVVRLVRYVRKPRSRLVATPGGLEFWSQVNGHPFLVRMADIGCLAARLQSCGVQVSQRFATEFFDTYRLPAGAVRNGIIRLNHLWFRLGLPAFLSAGNALIGQKA